MSEESLASNEFKNEIVIGGGHRVMPDKPPPRDGGDLNPSPYDLVLSSLGACITITLNAYARRHGMALDGVNVELERAQVYPEDCMDCDVRQEKIDTITQRIALQGDLKEPERQRLRQIADMSPVNKTLESSRIVAETSVVNTSSVARPAHVAPMEVVGTFAGRASELSEGFKVRRLLPYHRCRSSGYFVFLDHFGPANVAIGAPMDVGPHPHIGLSTLTYLYSGAIVHRDSTGAERTILPGEVNWMIAGRGVTHSERGREALVQHPEQTISHGLQLWVALPKEQEDVEPSFHSSQTTVGLDAPHGCDARLIVGKAFGKCQHAIPILEGTGDLFFVDCHFIKTGTSFKCDQLSPSDVEVGVYCSQGIVECSGFADHSVILESGGMTVFRGFVPSQASLTPRHPDTRLAIVGGTKLPEKRHMFWNYVSHDKAKIAQAVQAWDAKDRSMFPAVVNESNDDSIPNPTSRKSS